jgi:cytochrome P450
VQTFILWAAPFTLFERCRRRYGSSFTIKVTSHPPMVILSDHEDIRAMFRAPADALHPGEGAAAMLEPIVGPESFMSLEEDEHLVGRRAVLLHLHAKAVRRNAEMVAAVAERGVASWPRNVPFALHPHLRALSLEVALRSSFGVPGRTVDDGLDALRDRLLRMLAVTGSPVFPEPLLRHGPGRRVWNRFLRERAELDELLYELIGDRGRADGTRDSLFEGLVSTRNRDGTLMSPQQVRDNLMSMIVAGHETTAAELAWAFQLLAHSPDVLDTLVEAIDADGGEEYLTATIHEVLRHRPVFPMAIPRAVKRPVEIGGWIHRPPAHLQGCIYLVHHDPNIYPHPQEFRPERFLGCQPQAHVWMPWGGGRKRCPGLHLAMLEMKVVLRTVLATTTVRPAARRIERPRWRSVIVTPHAGSRVVLEERRPAARRE